jgi:hypothetical protein
LQRVHELVASKGVDFATEVELGHAPPLQYLVSNAEARDEADDGDEGDEGDDADADADEDESGLSPEERAAARRKRRKAARARRLGLGPGGVGFWDVDGTVGVVKRRIAGQADRLASLRVQHEAHRLVTELADDAPYAGQLGLSSYPQASLPAYHAMRALLMERLLPAMLDRLPVQRDPHALPPELQAEALRKREQ